MCSSPSHRHTLTLFTERVAPRALSSKYGSRAENSPPPLLFSHPQPLSTREGQECQSSTVQPGTVWKKNYPLLIFYYFSLFLFILEDYCGNGIVVVSSTCVILLTVKIKPQINTQNHKKAGMSQQCEHTDLIVFVTSESVVAAVQ